jgi:uncharacterized membrane protein (UPF0127 family)
MKHYIKIAVLLLALLMLASFGPQQELKDYVVFPDGWKVVVILADTPEERATGLRDTLVLAQEVGMLFVYPTPSHTSFWMPREMKYTLDMIFMNEIGTVVHIAHRTYPCMEEDQADCPVYSPDFPVSYVLEIHGSMAKFHNLKVGDNIMIHFDVPTTEEK